MLQLPFALCAGDHPLRKSRKRKNPPVLGGLRTPSRPQWPWRALLDQQYGGGGDEGGERGALRQEKVQHVVVRRCVHINFPDIGESGNPLDSGVEVKRRVYAAVSSRQQPRVRRRSKVIDQSNQRARHLGRIQGLGEGRRVLELAAAARAHESTQLCLDAAPLMARLSLEGPERSELSL